MTTSDSAAGPASGPVPEHPLAGMDRRFYGFVLDRLLAWTVYAGAAYAAYRWLIEPGRTWAGAGAIAGTVLLVGLLTSVSVGLTGATPANLAVGLRVVSVTDGRPIGVGRALLRTFVLGAATLPTFGFGAAALAVTAVGDPTGRRRGWHDLRARSVVVDVRPQPVADVAEQPQPAHVVNLTALRLVPASPHPPSHVPARRSRPVDKPLPPRLGPATPSATAPAAHGLGWPLVGTAPDEQQAAPGTLGPLTPASPPVVGGGVPGRGPSPAPSTAPSAGPSTGPAMGALRAGPEPAAPAPASGPALGLPPPPPPPPAPPDPPVSSEAPTAAGGSHRGATRWRVTFDTGEAFEVGGLTLVGRRPEGRSGEPVQQLVALPSTDMSLSKTHAQFQVVPDGALVVMDRGSTNGSILIRAGVTRKLEGGRPQTLRDGDRVRFGDREMTVALATG